MLLVTNGEGLGGEVPVNVSVPYSAQVFCGNGVWNSSGGSLWSSNGNWTDANGVQAAPGTFCGCANTDSATFCGAGSVTSISLGGANPSLQALNLSGSNYSLAGGTLTLSSTGTATVTVSGSQSIGSLVSLAGGTEMVVANAADVLSISGPIAGGGSLVKSGAGMLVLGGSNVFGAPGTPGHGTTVTAGTLQLGNSGALGAGGLTLGGGLVDLAGYSPVVAGLGGSAGTISNSGAPGTPGQGSTLTVNQAAAATFGGTLADGSGRWRW